MTVNLMPVETNFARWQPIYAEHRIPIFPVTITPGSNRKKPAVRNYLKIGSNYSQKLTRQFADAEAFGFAVGERSKITVLDIDTPDERMLADAMSRHGKTPFIVRSGSGNFQGWYRWNGERRAIRPDREKPIDILGGGYVVAPPSRGARGHYEIIQGSLDDLDRLPTLNAAAVQAKVSGTGPVGKGSRNNTLWRHCMEQARACDDFDTLLDVARTFNSMILVPPLEEDEVAKVAASAWRYTSEGKNRFGQHGAWFPSEEINRLVQHEPDAFVLLCYLRANNSPEAEFMATNGLSTVLRWPRQRVAGARRRLIELGYIEQIRRASSGSPAMFRWKGAKENNRRVFVEDRCLILDTLSN